MKRPAALSDAFDLGRLRWLRVEDSGAWYDADIKNRECSCAQPTCEHLALVRDVVDLRARNFVHEVRSGFQKEVRRGDAVAALRWARWFETFYGVNYCRRHLTELLFEETRNILLLVEWQRHHKLSFDRMVRDLLGSRKKWEIESRHKVCATEAQLAGYASALVKHRERPITEIEVKRAFLTSDDPTSLYETVWRVRAARGNDHLSDALKAFVRERARRHGGDAEMVADARWFSPMLVPEVVIEIITGAWDESANEIAPLKEVLLDSVPAVPARPPYLYDPITPQGNRSYAKQLATLRPGVPQPDGIDVRWSGMMRGVVWRDLASRAVGSSIRDCAWESVEIPTALWAQVVSTDGFLFEKLHAQAGL